MQIGPGYQVIVGVGDPSANLPLTRHPAPPYNGISSAAHPSIQVAISQSGLFVARVFHLQIHIGAGLERSKGFHHQPTGLTSQGGLHGCQSVHQA
jgi:hypothetical protein